MGFLNPTFLSLTAYYTARIGINNSELARRMGVRRETWWRYSKNPKSIPMGVFQDYCRVLQLSDDERVEVSKLCR